MQILIVLSLLLNLACLALLFFLLSRNTGQELAYYLQSLEKGQERVEKAVKEEIARNRGEFTNSAKGQLDQLHAFSTQLQTLTQVNDQKLEQIRLRVEEQLEKMRATVEEKLQSTLEKRLGESFKLVSDKLESVHKGLGEMQTLASGVGDLKRIMSNVKTRGIWGEIHLGNLIEQLFTPEQYEKNVATKPGSNERVEFALKLPGRDKDIVWLPIDAKFPQEDYQRLLDAQEMGEPDLAETAAKGLEARIKSEAKDICTKYISVPETTDFAILFLPIEGLYAEVLRRPGLYDTLLRDYRVAVCGPTTLSAFLNSLQMGFRTLTIEKRSSEVWQTLGAVKNEFNKFGTLIEKAQKKLQETSNVIGDIATRSRAVKRKLKNVEELSNEDDLSPLEENSALPYAPHPEG